MIEREDILLNNGANPKYSVAAIAKRDMQPGYYLEKGIGGFDVRGSSVPIMDMPNHVPIGLLQRATINKKIERGQIIEWTDIEMPPSRAKDIWFEMHSTLVS